MSTTLLMFSVSLRILKQSYRSAQNYYKVSVANLWQQFVFTTASYIVTQSSITWGEWVKCLTLHSMHNRSFCLSRQSTVLALTTKLTIITKYTTYTLCVRTTKHLIF